jgi:hypothetical protein
LEKIFFFQLFFRPFFDSKSSQSEENFAQSPFSPETHRKTQSIITKQSSQDSSNNPTSLQETNQELSSTIAGRAVSSIAKIATNKMSELLSIY